MLCGRSFAHGYGYHSLPTSTTPPSPLLQKKPQQTTFLFHLSISSTPISSSLNQTNLRDEDEQHQQYQILRKQNSKSIALVSHISSPPLNQIQEPPSPTPTSLLKEQIKLALNDEYGRPPTFPGSISPVKLGPSDLDQLFSERTLKQALEIRRNLTSEILKEAMKASKFSITYSGNLVSHMPGFVDHVMIEAASLKQSPEFAHSTFNARAKAYIQASNVIPLIRWLKHNSLTYTQIGKIICMACGNLETVRHLIEWLKSIYVKGRFLGVAVTRVGTLLKRSPDELDAIVEYLESKGVKRDWMGFIVSRCPGVLSFTMEDLKSRVNFYLELGMNEKDFGTMVYDYPKALGFFSIEEMHEKVKYLMEFGLGTEDVGRLLAFKPQLMGYSIEDRWKPLVKYLYYLGVRRDGMRRILVMKPMIFCVDLESTIVPKVRFLQDIGVREDAIGGVIVKFPPLLTYSLYKKIRPLVIFLITKAGVARSAIGKVIALEPELVGCSMTNKLEVNVKYFLSLGIPLRSLGEMIADFPMLLRYNLDVLRPKYRYLRRMMVRPLHDLIEFPRFFSYSLEGRIIPRHKILVENRINFKLRYMLASPDEDFDKRVEEALERRRRFEYGGMNNQSSSDSTDRSEIEYVETGSS